MFVLDIWRGCPMDLGHFPLCSAWDAAWSQHDPGIIAAAISRGRCGPVAGPRFLECTATKGMTPMIRQGIGSGGPLEPICGDRRAVRAGLQVHVAGTTARGEALIGDAYV